MLSGEYAEAYDNFYKCIWTNENKSAAFYYLAALALRRGDARKASEHARDSLLANGRNVKALCCAGAACRGMGDEEGASRFFAEAERADPLDCIARYERALREGQPSAAFGEGVSDYEVTDAAKDYLLAGERVRARSLLEDYLRARSSAGPAVDYYLGYIALETGGDCTPFVEAAGRHVPDDVSIVGVDDSSVHRIQPRQRFL